MENEVLLDYDFPKINQSHLLKTGCNLAGGCFLPLTPLSKREERQKMYVSSGALLKLLPELSPW